MGGERGGVGHRLRDGSFGERRESGSCGDAIMVEIKGDVSENDWRRFLDVCSDATLYHTPEWKTFLEKTFDYKPRYLFATDESGQLTGMLPLFEVRSRLTGNRLCSVPFAHYCGPIGDSEAVYALLNRQLSSFDPSETSFVEIRGAVNHDQFESQNSFSKYSLDLSVGLDQIWTKFERDVRKGIRKSQRSGVVVYTTEDLDDLKTFYELNGITKKNIGVPAHPWEFFKNLFKYLGDYEQLFLAKYEGEIIGGGIREYYGPTVLAGYSASNNDYAKYYPYNAINWASIQDACQKGYKNYDLGRVSYDNGGLEFYKSRWGTVETKLFYSYFPRNPVTLSGNRSCLKYKIATKMIQRMPMPLHKVFSGRVFQHFG